MVGKGKQEAHDPMEALQEGYKKGENDQIFTPTTIVDESGKPVGPVQDDDVVIFYNYREDRARQITKAFVLDDFDPFERDPRPKNLYFLTMTGYEEGLPVEVLFEPHIIKSTLSSIISDAGYTQLHMSETEKYAHISYFFNGGVEKPHEGELFFNIPSPKVFDYSDTPAMSAEVIRDEAVNRIESGKYNFVMMNFANPDMLGHTGDFDATVESIQIMDKCVRDVIDAIQKMGGDFIITADHGNCEEMIDESTNEVNTSHSINPVPLIICNEGKKIEYDRDDAVKIGTGEDSVERGILADVAPTILGLMGLEPTEDMTGIDILPVLKG
jgi:2,3-bisphosphoglycerate-independent phosphoglycerate mutase